MPPRHLIHVGFPKSASKSLQAWFEAHPSIVATRYGIVGFPSLRELADDISRNGSAACYVTSAEELVMPPAVHDLNRFVPPAGVAAEMRQRTTELLRALFADPTILIVTRAHGDAVASGYSEHVREGGWHSIRFQFGVFRWNTVGIRRMLDVLADQWDYDAAIAEYERAFGSDNVIVLPFEMLRNDPDAFLTTLEDRLGLPHMNVPLPRLNTSLTDAELRWYPRLSLLLLLARPLLGPFFGRVRASYRRQIGGRRLTKVIALLNRVLPARPLDVRSQIPDGLVAHLEERATTLVNRPEYVCYRDLYQHRIADGS